LARRTKKEDHCAILSIVLSLPSSQKNRKFFPIHVTKAYRASRGMAPLILNLGNFPSRREPCYLLDKRQGGPQIRSQRIGEGKNILPLHILELWIIQPVR